LNDTMLGQGSFFKVYKHLEFLSGSLVSEAAAVIVVNCIVISC